MCVCVCVYVCVYVRVCVCMCVCVCVHVHHGVRDSAASMLLCIAKLFYLGLLFPQACVVSLNNVPLARVLSKHYVWFLNIKVLG